MSHLDHALHFGVVLADGKVSPWLIQCSKCKSVSLALQHVPTVAGFAQTVLRGFSCFRWAEHDCEESDENRD